MPLCKQHEETIDHLTSRCPILEKNEYLMRHDKLGAHLHYSICKALSIKTTDIWYTNTHTPKPVCEREEVTVLWNQGVYIDRKVIANRPDIITKNKKEKTCILIDVAIPADTNVTQKGAEKKIKYISLCIEITMNVKHEMYDYTCSNWSHWNSNKRLKEKFRSHTRKTFNKFTTKDSYTWNNTHRKYCSLKLET
jgi:hypothetical protein